MIHLNGNSELVKIKQANLSHPRRRISQLNLIFKLCLIIFSLPFISTLSYAAEIKLAWDASDMATGYILYCGSESRTYEGKIDVGGELQHTITNLNDNQSYYCAVTAYNQFGESEFSNEISFITGGGMANEPPMADAGSDQYVDEGDVVLLDGSYSSDLDDGIATYNWEQVEGSPVVLSDSAAIEPNFTSPEIDTTSEKLTFVLTVSDHGGQSASDQVDIYVNDIAGVPVVEYCEAAGSVSVLLWISNLTLGEFSWSSAGSPYSDFTSEVIEVQKGGSYSVNLRADPAIWMFKYWRIWLDLNHDGDFDDPGEVLFEISGTDAALDGQITVPDTAVEGSTRLRVSMGIHGYPNPCENIYFGEVEDYTLLIAGDPLVIDPENEPPTADAGSDQYVDEGDMVLLNGSYSSDPDDGIATYNWEQVEGSPVVLSDSAAIEPNFTSPEIDTTSEKLTFVLTVSDHGGQSASDQVDIYVNDIAGVPVVEYCEAAGSVSVLLWISNLTLGEFSWSSAGSPYSDFTSEVIEVQKGGSYSVNLRADPAIWMFKYWRIWLDLNHDGDFDDPGEELFEISGADAALDGQITIPDAAVEGSTRLRVSMGIHGYPNPCENVYYGEVEDYTLHIW